MRSVGAQPTSSTPAPTTGPLTPPTVGTQPPAMGTPGLAGLLTEIAPRTTLLGQGEISRVKQRVKSLVDFT